MLQSRRQKSVLIIRYRIMSTFSYVTLITVQNYLQPAVCAFQRVSQESVLPYDSIVISPHANTNSMTHCYRTVILNITVLRVIIWHMLIQHFYSKSLIIKPRRSAHLTRNSALHTASFYITYASTSRHVTVKILPVLLKFYIIYED